MHIYSPASIFVLFSFILFWSFFSTFLPVVGGVLDFK